MGQPTEKGRFLWDEWHEFYTKKSWHEPKNRGFGIGQPGRTEPSSRDQREKQAQIAKN
jgi:hypothetical protein